MTVRHQTHYSVVINPMAYIWVERELSIYPQVVHQIAHYPVPHVIVHSTTQLQLLLQQTDRVICLKVNNISARIRVSALWVGLGGQGRYQVYTTARV